MLGQVVVHVLVLKSAAMQQN